MLSESEIEAKYKIVFINKQRYYYEDLSEKDYSLECTTPLSLEVEGRSFITSSWKQLLIDVFTYFLEEQPWKKSELLNYISDWNRKKPFSDVEGKNYYSIGQDVYLICNHTALHACWILRDVLTIFDVNLKECKFIIHRAPLAEPHECRLFFEEKTKSSFKYYYTQLLKHTDEQADQVLRNISKLNKYLAKVSHSYDNFLLFDDLNTYANYKIRLLSYFKLELGISENNQIIAEKYLTILGDFYKAVL